MTPPGPARVVVTGAGGGVGQSVIKALAGSEFTAVAVDADPLAAGLYLAADAAVVPLASHPDYVEELLAVCRSVGAVAVIPGLDPELPALAAAADRFAEEGVRVVVSPPEVVGLCDDKLATADLVRRSGFGAPDTVPFTDDVDDAFFPCVVKPRFGGSRSAGVFAVMDRAGWERVRALVDPTNAVIQRYVDGTEHTCGSVTLGGRCRGVIAMRRVLRSGDTVRATVVRHDRIEDDVRALLDALQPVGPCNVQLRLEGGRPVVFEINPRCSGTTAARALAGFNEPLMTLRWLLSGAEPAFERREMAIVRFWQELVVEPARFQRLAGHTRAHRAAAP